MMAHCELIRYRASDLLHDSWQCRLVALAPAELLRALCRTDRRRRAHRDPARRHSAAHRAQVACQSCPAAHVSALLLHKVSEIFRDDLV